MVIILSFMFSTCIQYLLIEKEIAAKPLALVSHYFTLHLIKCTVFDYLCITEDHQPSILKALNVLRLEIIELPIIGHCM